MFKIAICVRNRLGITKKCIEAIKKHTKLKHEIYIFDNLTNYRLNDHFLYFNNLFKKGIIQQYTVNSQQSTFDAFSKVVAINQFGYNHQMDPNKNKCDFLVFMDNDMIVNPEWDLYLNEAWIKINEQRLKDIHVVTQYPGGMKQLKPLNFKIRGADAFSGKLGGSGFWATHTNFFTKVGFLNCGQFLKQSKKHDQQYWGKLNRASSNRDYMVAIHAKMVLHTGDMVGSVCNVLTRNSKNIKIGLDKAKFKDTDAKVESLSFDDFYNGIKDQHKLYKW